MEPSLIFAHEMDAHGDHMGMAAHNDFLFQHCLGGASYIHDPIEHDSEMQNIQYHAEYDMTNTKNTAHAQPTTRQTYLDVQVQRCAQNATEIMMVRQLLTEELRDAILDPTDTMCLKSFLSIFRE